MLCALPPIITTMLLFTLILVDVSSTSSDENRGAGSRSPGEAPPLFDSQGTLRRLPAPPQIKVRLLSAPRDRVDLSIDGPYVIVDTTATDPTLPQLAAGENLGRVPVTASPYGILINGHPLNSREISIRPRKGTILAIEGRRYRGVILFRTRDSGGLDTLNIVEVESYLAGVLLAEMPSRFSVEALRGQTVAARSYALRQAWRGFELRDDEGSQVYRGVDGETARSREIVQSTLGEVLIADESILPAYFHSTCGGSTSSGAAVFGMPVPLPMLGGVTCGYCNNSPYFRWARDVATSRIDQLYDGALGVNLEVRAEDLDETGRVLAVAITSSVGKVLDLIPAERFKNDINVGYRLSAQLLSSFWEQTGSPTGHQKFDGRGFGHGVGLCQYGAEGMGELGHSYRQILDHYYPGSQLFRLYD